MFTRMVRTPVGLKKLVFASQFRSLLSSTYCAVFELTIKSNPCMSESCDWLSNDSIYISVRKGYNTDAVDFAFVFALGVGLAYGIRGVDEERLAIGPYELFAGGPFGAGNARADVFAVVAGVGFRAGGGPGFLPTPPPTGKPGSIASWALVRAFGIAPPVGGGPPPPPPWLKKSGW